MEFTGLGPLAHKPTLALSKGMKQRLCLARALIHDPPVLVLDEPAAGLDPRARVELRQMIRHLADSGKAVLISSHILSELGEICDSVAVIEQGRLRAVGSLEQIRRRITQTVVALCIKVLNGAQQAETLLASHPRVQQVRACGQETLQVQFQGAEEEQARLLAWLVGQRVPVVHFSTQHQSLEEVFLALTEGEVQ